MGVSLRRSLAERVRVAPRAALFFTNYSFQLRGDSQLTLCPFVEPSPWGGSQVRSVASSAGPQRIPFVR